MKKTAICNISVEIDIVQHTITVIYPTKTRIKIMLSSGGVGHTIDWFVTKFPGLYSKIYKNSYNMDFHEIELTYDDMKVLRDIWNYVI